MQRPFTYKDNKKIVSLRENIKFLKKFLLIQKSAREKFFLCAFKLNVIHRRLPPVESLCFNLVSIYPRSVSLKLFLLIQYYYILLTIIYHKVFYFSSFNAPGCVKCVRLCNSSVKLCQTSQSLWTTRVRTINQIYSRRRLRLNRPKRLL